MTKHIAGNPISEPFVLRGSVAGETFTISEASGPGGGAWAGPTITEASGVYTVSGSEAGTETTLGLYQATITGNTTGQSFDVVWEVIAAPAAQFPARANGQVPTASWWNDLQNAVSELKGRLG